MQIQATDVSITTIDADVAVVGLWSDETLTPAARAVDEAGGGILRGLLERKEATGKLFELTLLHGVPGVSAPLIVVVGMGEAAKCDAGTVFRAAAAAARQLSSKPRKRAAYYLAEGPAVGQESAVVCGAISGSTGGDLYRKDKKRHAPEKLLIAGGDVAAVVRGKVLGEAMTLARRLVNEPPHAMYPESFAAEAERVAKESGLGFEVWDKAKLERERCGSLLAVASGSARPPRLVILEYRGGKGEPPMALIGKGVTFDSGGLSLKPTDSMTAMKCDMAGGATVLAVMQAAAHLKLPINLVGLIGLVENMTGGAAMKLGDVLTARSGKTIEVLNTDAEGRLVLADVINVALDRKPARMIDLATLTGACVVALGTETAGAFTNDQAWCDAVLAAARRAGEPLWQLPMFPEYSEHIRSEIADIKNTGDGRWGGAITAAKFLEEFVEGTPWVHLDIAGPAFYDKPRPWCDFGASGCMVRALVELLEARP